MRYQIFKWNLTWNSRARRLVFHELYSFLFLNRKPSRVSFAWMLQHLMSAQKAISNQLRVLFVNSQLKEIKCAKPIWSSCFTNPRFMNFYRGFKWYFYSENLLTKCVGHFKHLIFSMPCFQVSINSQVSLNTLNDSQSDSENSAGYVILNHIKLNQSKHCKHLISD